MINKIVLFLACLFFCCCAFSVGWAEGESRYPVMRPDTPTLIQWMEEYESAPLARLDYDVSARLNKASWVGDGTSMDLADLIDYDPNQRNQGSCGNCWVWAGTGVMEIAHNVENGVFDRHSIQYLNSCRTGFACCGGGLGGFADWYTGEGQTLPWSNTNAAFADGAKRCSDGGSDIACGDISTTPNFPINSIDDVTIETHNIAQTTAIANIKNILNQDKGVYFSFGLPSDDVWGNFFDFWDGDGGETEATLWTWIDENCNEEWEEGDGGAGSHAVLILGYNDDDADTANHYWLALNSWGTAGGVRPNGFFRIPMYMDYDCSYPDDAAPSGYSGWWAFGFQTLDIEFGNSPPTSNPGGPYAEECTGETTDIVLDGSGSSDPEGEPLTFAWSTDCDGSFVDHTSVSPTLTVNTSPGCTVACNVFLEVSDGELTSESAAASVTVSDNYSPEITCPPDVIIECDESTDPGNTGVATATDACDPAPDITYTDSVSPGTCLAESSIARTFTATDECGNSASCVQTIDVVDTTAPVIECNSPMTITPPDAPISFTATATDNCAQSPSVEIVKYRCYKVTKKGKRINKKKSCVVEVNGDTINIIDSGGVADNIEWKVKADDGCGNVEKSWCSIVVVNPGHNK